MSKKDKKRIGPANNQTGEQLQQRQQPRAVTREEIVFSIPLLPPDPPRVITEEDVRVAAAALDAGASVHPGWAALFQWGLEYAERKEREAQRVEEPIEGAANGQA